MKHLYSILLLIIFLTISCGEHRNVEKVADNVDTLKVDTDRIINNVSETLIPNAKKTLFSWKEYKDVDEFMLKYYNVSNLEALNNAKELSELVKLMKDSIRIEKLEQKNVVARFNVLHNETLRLADMANIPSISKEEVKEEVKKIIDLFSAVNSKINTIYKAEDIQNALEVDTEIPLELEKLDRERFKKRPKKYKPIK
ncbi:hypothetical protein [Lutibacter citreus]|uniref:hypothetical protein n=1 Tax=Lutibacter citreus TaxID=2138210 RepID=UPI000DBE64E3|nr:hypothetical protein [Lutibacter citreus]